MKVTHIITGLNVGGAEMMLYKLLSATDRQQFECEVISMTDIGPVGEKIAALGIPVRALEMPPGVPSPLGLVKLIKWLRQSKPDVVQSWIYQADLISGIAVKLAGNMPLVWGIRNSNLSVVSSKRSVRLIAKLCAFLSAFLPTKILCCSEASLNTHQALGYDASKMLVICNGFNVEQFKAQPDAKTILCKELGLDSKSFLIGQAGRFDPQKDHKNFVRAAGILAKKNDLVHFVLCGAGMDEQNETLMRWINAEQLVDRVHLLGLRDDMADLISGLDVYSSSSLYGEGFPNVIGEAMACETPCVVTDVGDSALIVGDTGIVVEPANPNALANGWLEIIEKGKQQRRDLGQRARQRVLERFSLEKIVSEYEGLYQNLTGEAS